MPSVDISVPMHLRKLKQGTSQHNEAVPDPKPHVTLKSLQYLKSQATLDEEQEEADRLAASVQPSKQVFNFVIMSKKNNKPQYHSMNVPLTSTFANQFRAREEAEKVEKEKLKQLTLNINERIEQEELQGGLRIFFKLICSTQVFNSRLCLRNDQSD